MTENLYENPLVARYASRRMAEFWSGQKKFSTWRRLSADLMEDDAEFMEIRTNENPVTGTESLPD